MGLINWARNWWRNKQHQLDVEILWPSCLKESESRDEAKQAFRQHMLMDQAYAGMTEKERQEFLERLP